MDLKTVLNQKKSLKSSITRLKTKTEGDINELDLEELDVRKIKISGLRDETRDIFSDIINKCKDDEVDNYSIEKDDLLDTLETMLANINRNIRKHSTSSVEHAFKSQHVKHSESTDVIKLPALSLPIFSGVIEEWLTFSDLFKAAVSDNPNLSGAQKLQYLKGVLRSEAQKIVQTLPITDSNFKIAWELLTERYFNKREILSSVMRKFITLTPINNESHSQMLGLVDSTKEFVRTLESLDFTIDKTSDTFLMFSVLFKLDPNTRTWFERTMKADEIPTLEELLKFLSTHARSLMTGTQTSKRNFQKRVSLVATSTQSQCPFCQSDHTLGKCEAFTKLPVQKRLEFVKSNNVCFNCLAQFHAYKSCKSKFRCRTCKKPHHTLLHMEGSGSRGRQTTGSSYNRGLSIDAPVFSPGSFPNESASNEASDHSGATNLTSCVSNVDPGVTILLCTAIIRVKDFWGNYQTCRCLLDSGSQASLITSQCLERLGLSKQKADIRISCLGATDARTNGISEIHFTSHFPSQSTYSASVYVVNKIVGLLPHHSLASSYCDQFADLKLADPNFHISSPVDILLGVDLTLPLLKGQTLSLGKDKPFAIRSELGWVIGGSANSISQNSLYVNKIELVSDDLVHKFWELDSVPCAKPLTSLEKSCEEHFVMTHSRDESGRYTVRLPFHTPPAQLGNSKQNALRRLINNERHLNSNVHKYEQYRKFIKEYIDLNHMEPVPKSAYNKPNSYYLPHHAVVRESSSTTKLRVVFDASCKTSSGLSLNDLLLVGPRVQPELFPILIQFRLFQVAICADVEKMFRQIRIHEEDADWQRILWRDSPDETVKEYRLNTVTYGTACAPYLSTRILRQLAEDEKEKFPSASRATLRHFYVDDLLSGASTKEEAMQLVTELQEMMKKGGFSLRKWISTIPDVLKNIPEELRAVDTQHTFDKDQSVKILGIAWLPGTDTFTFNITVSQHEVLTKRRVLSDVARIFDPLGWLAPTVIIAKIFLQELWSYNLGWDEELPEQLTTKWRTFQEQLPLLSNIKVPRSILVPNPSDIQVHGFCDSSEKAYCAALYILSVDSEQKVTTALLTSKTRVAPVKSQSLPRLELCSALLLATLLQATLPTLNIPISGTFAWSDSKITLAWIQSEPRRWQPFVANRVAQIQELVPNVHWNFVSGLQNPADCGTRGIPPEKLMNCDFWFKGPDWLKNSCFPSTKIEEDPSLSEVMSSEEKKTPKIVMLQAVDESFKIETFHRFSSWNKMTRVLAWCLRFVKNCAITRDKRMKTSLTTVELNEAEKTIVKFIQQDHFSIEISCLSAGKQLPSSNRLNALSPFCDDSGLLRVGGRLKNSMLPEEQKHPLLLPKTDHVVDLIITDYHLRLLHAGPQLLQAALREKFWILSARDAVRRVVRKCNPCFKNRPRLAEQIMGDLPEARVCPSSVFQKTGLDFAGPFLIRSSKGRGSRNTKCYICVFVCLATKAAHLEVVSDLSTKAFIACLKRFVARRGKPTEIFCDHGTNFFGASRELKREFQQLMKDERVHQFLLTDNITFRFNPPSAPHFGGIWESAVKSFKFHLKRVLGSTSVTFEELATLSSQIEACLNSRPLCALSNSPDDLCPLTPGHFLIGKPLTAVPQPTVPDHISHCDRWRMLQRMVQHFWNRWSAEYLTSLQSRSKWRVSQKNLEVGDLVLIKNENLPPLQWKLGKILKTFPGKDNKVRVVEVKTQTGELIRPIAKLCPLPMNT